MAEIKQTKGVIGILTGGGDVPGLNPAIRSVTVRAIRENYRVVGIRRGWEGLISVDRSRPLSAQSHCMELTEDLVNVKFRTGGTFLHTSRTNPIRLKPDQVPVHLRGQYQDEVNDLTPEVLKNIDYLGLDYLIPIGGDDTLSYGAHLHKQGIKVIAIPKTMDNDVPGTEYCIGFSTCITRTIDMVHALRTPAGSHERFLIIEVFGRYAGYTALLPAMAGAANRCLIPEYPFDVERVTELLSSDRRANPSRYAVLLVSEGAMFAGGEMVFQGGETDSFGHKKLGGIGEMVSARIKQMSPKYNAGERINTLFQRLGYLVRSGAPDALDSIVPMAFGNLALRLILNGLSGRLVCLKNGKYDHEEIEVVTSTKKVLDVEKFYHKERYRPLYVGFQGLPLMLVN